MAEGISKASVQSGYGYVKLRVYAQVIPRAYGARVFTRASAGRACAPSTTGRFLFLFVFFFLPLLVW